MELLESDDPVKGQLLKKSAMHRQQIEEDTRLISEQTEKILTNALIIGGALAVTYLVINQFSGKKEKKKKSQKLKIVHEQGGRASTEAPVQEEPETQGVVSQIGAVIAGQATAFLLNLAKEKLMEFLEAQAAKKIQNDDAA